jgi:hypothetical protein
MSVTGLDRVANARVEGVKEGVVAVAKVGRSAPK